MGVNATDRGNIVVNDKSDSVTVFNDAVIGEDGRGVVEVKDGLFVVKKETTIGASGTGKLIVDGNGRRTLVQLGQSRGDAVVGKMAGSLGIINVVGPNARLSVHGKLLVGNVGGEGEVVVGDGTSPTQFHAKAVEVGGNGVGDFTAKAGADLSVDQWIKNDGSGTFNGLPADTKVEVKSPKVINKGTLNLRQDRPADHGEVHIVGDFVSADAGALMTDTFGDAVAGVGHTELLSITGTAQLAGTLHVAPLAEPESYEVGDAFTVLHAAGGIVGSFNAVDAGDLPLPAGLAWDIEYTGSGGNVTDVVLKVVYDSRPVVYGIAPLVTTSTAATDGLTFSVHTVSPQTPDYIDHVEFFQSTNTAIGSIADMSDLGQATQNEDDPNLWTLHLDTASFLSEQAPQTFLAVAYDAYGQISSADYRTLVPYVDANNYWNGQFFVSEFGSPTTVTVNPNVDQLTATTFTPSDSPLTQMIELDASGVRGANGGDAVAVKFYLVGGVQPVEIGTVAGGDSADFKIDFDVTHLTGDQAFFAEAIGADGQVGPMQSIDVNFNRPSIGSFGAALMTGSGGRPRLSLMVDDLDAGEDTEITSVSYYVDTSGMGPFDPSDGDAVLLGTVHSAGLGGHWTLDNIDMSAYSGAVTVYAIASNDAGWESVPVPGTITLDQPIVAGITASTDESSGAARFTLTAEDVLDAVGDVASVAFYRDTSGTGLYSASTVVPVGTADGSNGWTVSIDPRTLSGNETFFAIATDDSDYASVPVAVSVSPVVIGQLNGSNANLYLNGQATTITASGLVDWNVGATISSVSFFTEPPTSSSTPAHTDSSATGGWTWTFTPSGLSGPQTFYAIAHDSDGTDSKPIAITLYPHEAPTISGVEATTDSETGSHFITLSAEGVDDGSAVASVAFYRVGSSTPLGTITDADNGWTLAGIDTSGFSGPQGFYAVVTNDAGQETTSDTLTVSQITLGTATASPGRYVPGHSLTLTAADLLDWNSGSPTKTVSFYQDTTGTGDFADATLLGTGTLGDGRWTYTISDTSDWTGPELFFVQATDSAGGESAPVAIGVYPDEAPTLDGLFAVSDTSGSPTTLDFSADGMFDVDGSIANVKFYRVTSGYDPYNPDTAELLGTADEASGWLLSGVSGSSLESSGQEFFAIATDDDGGTSEPATLTLDPVTVDQLMSDMSEYVAGTALNLTASGITDWSGGTVSGVSFYRATDPDDPFNLSTAQSLGTDTTPTDGEYTKTVSTTGLTGQQIYFAIAGDGTWTSQPALLLVDANQAPTIADVSATIDSSSGSPLLTLQAAGVDDADGTAQEVNFYTYSASGVYNSSNWIGSDDGTNDWSIGDINVSGFRGPRQFVAIATDDLGIKSEPIVVTYTPRKLYFDPSGNLAHIDLTTGAGLGGSGSWNWTSSNSGSPWYSPEAGELQAWDSGGDFVAVFEGTSGTVSVSTGVTVDSIQLAGGYTLNESSGGAIALEGTAAIDVSAGTATINVPVTAGVNGLTKTGDGMLVIGAAPTLGNGIVLDVSEGKLKFNVTSDSATIGTGVTAVVAEDAILELSGSVSALGSATGHRVDITNDSQATGGGLVVSGTNQQVGKIDGEGDVVVAAGADITADRVRQNSLTIHGTSESLGLVRIRGSLTPAPHSDSQNSRLHSISIDNDGGDYPDRVYYGTFDLMNQQLIVSPDNQNETAAQAIYAAVNDTARSGYNVLTETGKNWNGTGITSSTAFNDFWQTTAVGVLLNDGSLDANVAAGTTPLWGGENSVFQVGWGDDINLSQYDTLVKYTFNCDLLLTGYVQNSDLDTIVANVIAELTPAINAWAAGDCYYFSAWGVPIDGYDIQAAVTSMLAMQNSPYSYPL